MARVLIAGTGSSCGKTTITLALLSAFRERGLSLASFKCGPDYIDPIFHRQLMGLDTRNLDPFFCTGSELRAALSRKSDRELSIIEGVMGYYDGIGTTTHCSSYEVARETKTPVILVIRPEGMCASAAALMRGFKSYKRDADIKGVIFSCITDKMYTLMKPLAEQAGLYPLGFLPRREELSFPSRRLGLVTDFAKAELQQRLGLLGELAEKYIDLSAVLELACAAPDLPAVPLSQPPEPTLKIAVAHDEAFCFIYEENLEALRAAGFEPCFFSPLRDMALPEGAGALYLPGGYPELYARELSENTRLLKAINSAVCKGLPTVAECGGFMYLHRRLDDYPMANVIPARTYKTDSLKRFGYVTLKAQCDSLLFKAGDCVPCHEFHYYDSTDSGDALIAEKAGTKTLYPCAHVSDTLYAGFPHLYFPAAPQLVPRLAAAAARYAEKSER